MSAPPPLPPKPNIGHDPAMGLLMPVGRSAWAIAAGYLALFAVLVFPAPLALLAGILAVKDIKKSKGTSNPKFGMGRAVFGIVMGLIGSAVLAFVIFAMLQDKK